MITAYIDESGNLADKEPFFIVAVVPIDNARLTERIIKRLRRVVGREKRKDKDEIKFSKISDRVKDYFIKRFEESNLYCFVFVINKNDRRIKDTPENYGSILAHILHLGFSIFNWEKAVIDKKFSKLRDQEKLHVFLQNDGVDTMKVNFVDSMQVDGVKLAEFVAGYYSGH